jgi:hypothetical protein
MEHSRHSAGTALHGRLSRPAIALAMILCLSACGGSDRRQVYPVRGQVLVDGKGAADALVFLHAVDDADPRVVRPFAQADKEGKFAISTYVSGDGAPPGDYLVTIEWRELSGLFKQDVGGPDRLKGAYADAKKAPFQITVTARDNDLPPFEISTKGK